MRRQKFIALILLFLSTNICAFGQTNSASELPTAAAKDEKARFELEAKAIALIERIAAEAEMLKTPENRVLLHTNAANAMWPFDEKRARLFFEQAGHTIVELLNESETDHNGVPQNLYRVQEARQQLLSTIGQRDPELALTLLVQTRSSFFERLSGLPRDSQLLNNYSWLLQTESHFEQQFATQAARQNPKRAAEIIRRSLATGFSSQIINTINQIKIKDASLASELADEVLAKLVSVDFAKQHNARNLSFSLIRMLGDDTNRRGAEAADKMLKFNQQNVRELTNKLASFYLKRNDQESDLNELSNSDKLSLLERFSPNSAMQLRRRVEVWRQNNEDAQKWERVHKLNNHSVEAMLAEAPNFSSEQQASLYSMAASKAVDSGEDGRALTIINQITSKRERDSALENYRWQLFHRAVQAKKFAEARATALQSERNSVKIAFLVLLAKSVLNANDHERAKQLLAEARSFIVENPSNQNELQDYVAYTRGTIAVEPEQTHYLLSVLVDNLNEMVAAYQTLSKFNNESQYFRDGEINLNSFSHQVWNFLPVQDQEAKFLANLNLEKSIDVANRLERPELRLLFKMQIASAILTDIHVQKTKTDDDIVRVRES